MFSRIEEYAAYAESGDFVSESLPSAVVLTNDPAKSPGIAENSPGRGQLRIMAGRCGRVPPASPQPQPDAMTAGRPILRSYVNEGDDFIQRKYRGDKQQNRDDGCQWRIPEIPDLGRPCSSQRNDEEKSGTNQAIEEQ